MAISSHPSVALVSVNTFFDEGAHGFGHLTLTFALSLRARGLSPLLAAPEGELSARFREEGFAVERLPRPFFFLPGNGWQAWRLARGLRRHGIGIVHALDAWSLSLASANAIRQVFATVGLLGSAGFNAKTYAELRRLDRVAAPSRALARLGGENGIEEDRLRVIPFGFDPGAFRPATESRDRLRERCRAEFRLDARHPLFLFNASPIRRDSGHGVILDALTKVVARLPQTFWICFGKTGMDPEAEERLARRAKELALDKHVAFLGGDQGDAAAEPRLNGPDFARAADLYVHVATPGESARDVAGAMTSGDVADAVASGLPVVATETPEIEAFVRDGQNGRLVSGADPGTLALALLEVLENRKQREHYGRIGESMAKHFAPDAVAGAFLDVYRELA